MRIVDKYIKIVLGAFLLAFAIYNIHHQSVITEGGILGMELLINYWFNISPGISGPILDILMYSLGAHFFGFDFLKRSIIASFLYGLFYELLAKFKPTLPSFYNQPLLAAIFGGLLVGIGVGLVVSTKSAAGGDDSLALIIQKHLKINIGYCYVLADFVVLLLSLSYIPFSKIIYSIITVSISSLVLGQIVAYIEKNEKDIIIKFATGEYLEKVNNSLVINNIKNHVYSPIKGKIIDLDANSVIIENHYQRRIKLMVEGNVIKHYVNISDSVGFGDVIFKLKEKNQRVKALFLDLKKDRKIITDGNNIIIK